MKSFFRYIKRKRNVRRIAAAAFVLIAVLEMGSHAVIDANTLAVAQGLPGCRVLQNRRTTVDCPDKQKNRGSDSNRMDELTIHAIILNDLTIPTMGTANGSGQSPRNHVYPLTGILAAPFHPPKQA